jgi:hypothetical protein
LSGDRGRHHRSAVPKLVSPAAPPFTPDTKARNNINPGTVA